MDDVEQAANDEAIRTVAFMAGVKAGLKYAANAADQAGKELAETGAITSPRRNLA